MSEILDKQKIDLVKRNAQSRLKKVYNEHFQKEPPELTQGTVRFIIEEYKKLNDDINK